jgi:hypothetical protein
MRRFIRKFAKWTKRLRKEHDYSSIFDSKQLCISKRNTKSKLHPKRMGGLMGIMHVFKAQAVGIQVRKAVRCNAVEQAEMLGQNSVERHPLQLDLAVGNHVLVEARPTKDEFLLSGLTAGSSCQHNEPLSSRD